MIAYLGTGLLGGNFVRAFLRNGKQVQVWNRTAAKAKELEQYGAKVFDTIAEAVTGADTIHLTLKDDASVDEVLGTALPGLKPGAIIIDHTTTSAEGARRRTDGWKEGGFSYVHAPVFMGPANALESTGFMLVSGDQDLIQQVTSELEQMTGKLLNFGPEVGKAAAMKLIGNCFLVGFTAGLADSLTLASSMDISSADVAGLFENWNPASMLLPRLQRMTAGKYNKPSWELSMARKDTGLFIQAAEQAGRKLAVMPAIATEMDRWIAEGHGNDDWTVLGKNSL
ncbi:MAG: NAD(P)-dependent oxidoreductase [Sphingobacteriales bacterium]|nr:MAG: NAD(P)-dependent oxidoreductase [Sphingobacteriales bacterium]